MRTLNDSMYNSYKCWLQTSLPEEGILKTINPLLPKEGYRIRQLNNHISIEGGSNAGLIYGTFALHRRLAAGHDIDCEGAPRIARRVINHWDNPDGSIERGYAGKSIFFKNGELNYSIEQVNDYARLLASIGINEITINNVNVSAEGAKLLTDMLPDVKKIADIFRPWNIRISLAINFESPVLLDGMPTADPLDPNVRLWWEKRVEEIYSMIPDFSGFLVKADSEFIGGPVAHGRTEADGANMLARILAPFGGVVYWRCFIYDCLQDWRDSTIDRPKAAYEIFMPQDGLFEPNVILQIKNGPCDFQVREPNSPLLGALKKTNRALELQITQEYTGQQIDLYYLGTQWEEVFSFPVDDKLVLRDLMGKKINCIVGISNIGNDENWTGNILAQANLYAFGRLAWDPSLTAGEILKEWIPMTFGGNTEVIEKIYEILMRSRETYEKYTTPMGLGWMVNVHSHYGPSPEGYEYSKWGTYHRANYKAIGIDRTSKGTKFTLQYHPSLTAMFDDINKCPEKLLLFFHRLNYSHVMKNGKTLLQHYYDLHFEGVEDVEEFIEIWKSLEPHLPKKAYDNVLERLKLQLKNAIEWRDVLNTYFYRFTGIPDAKGRKIYE
ncbi:MAG TPA: alpha-glucuronidase [Clostridiales bacterium]|nr:alpha-glucuronidase [Clostridiales bacterium]